MKNIRIAALGAALALGVGSSVELQAQATPAPQAGEEHGTKVRGERGQHRGHMQGRHMGRMFRDIELTDAQQAQVKEIHERYRPQMQALRPQARRDSSERPDSATRAQARALMERRHAEVRGVLTAAQQVTFDRNVAEMKERMERRGKEHGARKGGKRGARSGA